MKRPSNNSSAKVGHEPLAEPKLTNKEIGFKLEFNDRFNEYKAALKPVSAAIRWADKGLPAQVYQIQRGQERARMTERLDGRDARSKAAEAICAFVVEDEDNVVFSVRLSGILAASVETLHAVAELNEAKDALGRSVKVLNTELSRDKRDHVLEKIAPSIHLKQATRRLVVLDEKPKRVSFFWANGLRKRKTMTRTQTRRFLERKHKDSKFTDSPVAFKNRIEAALRMLDTFPDDMTFLYSEPAAPSAWANIKWANSSADNSKNMAFAALPIFYPADGGDLPEVIPLQNLFPGPRATRSDCRRGEPIFQGLHIYHYLDLLEDQPPPAAADTPPVG